MSGSRGHTSESLFGLAEGVSASRIVVSRGFTSCAAEQAMLIEHDWAIVVANHDRKAGHPPPSSEEFAKHIPLLAAYGASTFNRTVSRRGFEKRGRSMLTGDLVDLVGPVFEELFGEMQDVQLDTGDEDEQGGEKGKL